MVSKNLPATQGEVKIRHVGYLELSEFYKWLKRWLEFNGYWDNSNEKFYSENITPSGKKIDIKWECKKEKTKYFVYHIDVVFLLIGVNKVEMQQEDRKIKIEKGDFEIRVNAYMEKKSEDNNLWKIYEKILLNKQIDRYLNDLADKTNTLIDEIKAVFNQYVQ